MKKKVEKLLCGFACLLTLPNLSINPVRQMVLIHHFVVKGQLCCPHFFPYFNPHFFPYFSLQLFPYFSIYYSVQLAYII